MNKIFFLGATGRLGANTLDELLLANYQVHVLVRDSRKLKTNHANLRVFEGDTLIDTDLESAMVGCEAVISTLNISRNSDFPWSKLRTPKDFLSATMKKVVRIGREVGIRHLIVCSAWGVGDSHEEIPTWFDWFIQNSNIGTAYIDHGRQEELVRNSGIEYTIIRPSGLMNSQKEGNIIWSQKGIPKPSLTISRKSVAKALVQTLGKDDYKNKTFTVSSRSK